ncbi:MAG: sigma-70 family RNA polymerase sigma factor [Chitinispirillaceae bacterium]|nr:sigma-70 family RNA polymerase sigma factor [Chitinispirillaceae bacterium]
MMTAIYENYSDEFLIEKFCTDSDEKAMTELFRRLVNKARSVARLYLGSADQAEDAVQDTFIKIVRKTDRYDPKQPFLKWFYAVLRNECRDHLRKRRRRHADDILQVNENDLPYRDEMELRSESMDLLSRIGSRERAVIRLRIVDAMSYEEIAVAVGISVDAAKKRAQRGIARMREMVTCEKMFVGLSRAN